MYSIKLFKEQILNAKKIAIIGHYEPDADSLASAISIKRTILSNAEIFGEKQIDIYIEPAVIDPIYEPIIIGEGFLTEADDTVYDIVISVDCATLERMGKFAEVFERAKNTVVIDHHESNNGFAQNCFIYKGSSTCEIVYVLFKALNIELSLDVLKLIYAGIITDTVNLTQGTVKVTSYKIVAEIAERVNDIEALNTIKDHFLKNKTITNLRLLERALHSMQFYINDKLAIMKLTKDDLKDTQNGDTLGIVNHAINLKGVYIAILFIKQEDGSYYASLRGKNGIDVSKIASHFGGGGGESVAAFSYKQNLSELKEELLELCKNEIQDAPSDDDIGSIFAE